MLRCTFIYLACSESGETKEMFAVIFGVDEKENFLLSKLRIGEGNMVLKPQLEGEWLGLHILSTGEPLLTSMALHLEFRPTTFPSSVRI